MFQIDEGDFDAVGVVINEYLQTLEKDKLDANLELLKEWLSCKSCVDDVQILCNSCIFTLPPQSELKIIFISNNIKMEKTMDILMDSPLSFVGFHE